MMDRLTVGGNGNIPDSICSVTNLANLQTYIFTILNQQEQTEEQFHPEMAMDKMYVFQWFPDRKGLVSGLVVGGIGGGAFIFDQIQTAYVNPLNEKPELQYKGDNDR